jgi:hypothetical protein
VKAIKLNLIVILIYDRGCLAKYNWCLETKYRTKTCFACKIDSRKLGFPWAGAKRSLGIQDHLACVQRELMAHLNSNHIHWIGPSGSASFLFVPIGKAKFAMYIIICERWRKFLHGTQWHKCRDVELIWLYNIHSTKRSAPIFHMLSFSRSNAP